MNFKQAHQSKSNNNTATNKKYDGKKLKYRKKEPVFFSHYPSVNPV